MLSDALLFDFRIQVQQLCSVLRLWGVEWGGEWVSEERTQGAARKRAGNPEIPHLFSGVSDWGAPEGAVYPGHSQCGCCGCYLVFTKPWPRPFDGQCNTGWEVPDAVLMGPGSLSSCRNLLLDPKEGLWPAGGRAGVLHKALLVGLGSCRADSPVLPSWLHPCQPLTPGVGMVPLLSHRSGANFDCKMYSFANVCVGGIISSG